MQCDYVLCSNHLTSLPIELSHLSRLRVLRLKYNFFTDIPSVVSLLPALENLNLSGNRISALNSSSISVLSNIRYAAVLTYHWKIHRHLIV